MIPLSRHDHPVSWRSLRRSLDLIFSLYLLTYVFGFPGPSFGVPYGCKRHADPVMREAIDRGRLVEQVRHLEAMLDLAMLRLELEPE